MAILYREKEGTRKGAVVTKFFLFVFTAVFTMCTWGHGGKDPF